MQGLVGKREGKRQLVVRMGDTGDAGRVWWGNVRETACGTYGDTGGAGRVWWGNVRETACGTYGRQWRCMQGLVGKREGKREFVARMGDTGGACWVWWGNVRERGLVARMGDTGGACRVW